ncbi:MFS transporter [Amantichitinum ursilacus]|uniref:Enterobactin exporter EntS n=1 Tax=Amantichitinum ursilacus TaxID=857265 RepID=A0A0N0GQS7_9NEIS|nr:MFS transporter [Amantichitinum ursilacus]KPC54731.1 enterobactin exporter EntS [Amantichitinum ursilacus]
MTAAATGIFRSLKGHNYRVWAAGALVSNIGTWMQRTAQDWLVLTRLTHHNASAVGIVMALQFGPQLLLLPWTGSAADHYNQRKLLMVTQATLGALALVLGVLTITGVVALWQVYLFAFASGCAAAFDAPVRQTFVAELVGETDLPNAVALNSTSFNAGRMVGPAVAGLVIASIGTGWAFVVNGLSFFAVLISLASLRVSALRPNPRARRSKGSFIEGLRYVAARPDLKAILVMLFLIGTFGLNFQIFISTMAVSVFHADARSYGLLSSFMAVGTISGALLAAGRANTTFNALLIGSAIFGLGCTLAAIAPSYAWFATALAVIGIAAMTFTNGSNALMQLSTEPAMRGRVMALRLSIALGGTPIGAPIVGWVADHAGPRWALGIGAASGFAAAGVALYALRLRVHRPPAPAGGA